MLKIGDRIEVLRDDGIPARVIFDKVPPNLRASPTLSINVQSNAAGRRDVTLEYLTRGLSWNADYVAVFDERRSKLDMQGWITLTNNSGTTFSDAVTQLVAGDMKSWRRATGMAATTMACRNSAQSRLHGKPGTTGAGRQLADYYVYPLRRATTVANNQTKQVGFLERRAWPRARSTSTPSTRSVAQRPGQAAVVVRFSNSPAGGLGAQLPAGMVRVYARDTDGKPRFVGEDRIGHTRRARRSRVKIGDAFDVTIQPTLGKQDARVLAPRYEMSYLVRNARSSR